MNTLDNSMKSVLLRADATPLLCSDMLKADDILVQVIFATIGARRASRNFRPMRATSITPHRLSRNTTKKLRTSFLQIIESSSIGTLNRAVCTWLEQARTLLPELFDGSRSLYVQVSSTTILAITHLHLKDGTSICCIKTSYV